MYSAYRGDSETVAVRSSLLVRYSLSEMPWEWSTFEDKAGKLVNAQEGKTTAQRQWRFSEGDPVDENLVLAYVREAIGHQEAGRMVKPAPKKSLELPPELTDAFSNNPKLEEGFNALAPYKQREYAEHISGAKRADTRVRRLEKILPMILAGKGLNDRYRC